MPAVTDYSPKNSEIKLFANLLKKKNNVTFAK